MVLSSLTDLNLLQASCLAQSKGLNMVAIGVDSEWSYEFVPSAALPVVDLTHSLKSYFFSGRALRVVNCIVRRFQLFFVLCNIVIHLLAAMLGFAHAPFGRVAAVFILVLGVPSHLANLSGMRFEIVRLVLQEDNAVFLCAVNAITNVFLGIVFGDLRAVAVAANVTGWLNILFNDAQLFAVRITIRSIVLSMSVVSTLVVCVFLNRIEEPHGLSLWQYKNGDIVYSVPAIDYVANGLSTFFVLIAKIVYRKRESIHHSHGDEVIECAIIQCRIKLVPRGSQLAVPSNTECSCKPFATTANMRQRLQFVPTGTTFDARRVVFPATISCTSPFQLLFTRFLLALGCAGFGLLMATSYFVNRPSNLTVDGSLKPRHSHATAETTTAMAAFACSASFFLVFMACYQRDLLRTLALSFDFIFYSAQATATHLTAAVMYNWERNYCLWLLTCWVWTHWVFCLDALTPLMKSKLRFHVHSAIPVTSVLLIGMASLILGILKLGMNPPKGRAIWTGVVFGRAVTMKMLPFFVTRLLFMLAWMVRLLIRLCRASNYDAIILRGSVQYENNLMSSKHRINKHHSAPVGLHQVHPSSPAAENVESRD